MLASTRRDSWFLVIGREIIFFRTLPSLLLNPCLLLEAACCWRITSFRDTRMLRAVRVALAISSNECPANKSSSVRAAVVRIIAFLLWRRGGRIDSKCSMLITKLRHAVWPILTGAPVLGTLLWPSSIGNSLMIKQSKRTFILFLLLVEPEAAGSVIEEVLKMLGRYIMVLVCYSSFLILWAMAEDGNFRWFLLSSRLLASILFRENFKTSCLTGRLRCEFGFASSETI